MLVLLLSVPAFSLEPVGLNTKDVSGVTSEISIYLVQNTDNTDKPVPPPANLLLPDSMTQTNKDEKKCMTVCAQWGEDCTYINRGAAGMTRSCRRSCIQFTEECF